VAAPGFLPAPGVLDGEGTAGHLSEARSAANDGAVGAGGQRVHAAV